MQGHTHNLLNQSVAAGYRSGAKQGAAGSEHGDGEKVCSPWYTLFFEYHSYISSENAEILCAIKIKAKYR